jgi:hypothetical protein
MTKVKTRHKLFSMSGVTARVLILMSRVTPEPVDLIIAASFGIVEVLGVKRFWKVLGPAVKAQLKQQFGLTKEKKNG